MILTNVTKKCKVRNFDDLIQHDHLEKVKLNVEEHIKKNVNTKVKASF